MAWEKQAGHSVTAMFEDRLLKDAILDGFFNTTVEVCARTPAS